MPNDALSDHGLTQTLLDLTERARAYAEQDPFGNPVLAVALSINRMMDEADLTEPEIAALIRSLRDDAFDGRA
jgi:phosphoenolpyruvate carboxylase